MANDPGFCAANGWAARWHSIHVGQGWSPNPRADMEEAATLAARAIELDRQNAMALATCAHVRSFLMHDYDAALVYFERALSVGPNNALAWLLSSATLSYVGRTEEAIRHAEHGLRLSPFDQNLFLLLQSSWHRRITATATLRRPCAGAACPTQKRRASHRIFAS